jgi:hypothetical protein
MLDGLEVVHYVLLLKAFICIVDTYLFEPAKNNEEDSTKLARP